ncbi:CDP-diglyceride synthetase [Salirhabdus euzebyi]|uniref:CDP-diglyceride synthetase n=1 Tax=Salirhabdus euzebyi TaxID=394506 RepID=A0A841Q9N6_9BACI|nr:hypothetical protein [Salirhabdus euzebyi]MBB6454947.1 CDP-diglyceride synthetase [Salirhabdus euzebyi]
MYTIKFLLTWIIGIIVSAVIMAISSNEKVAWELVIILSVAGCVGVLISSGIKKALKKEED